VIPPNLGYNLVDEVAGHHGESVGGLRGFRGCLKCLESALRFVSVHGACSAMIYTGNLAWCAIPPTQHLPVGFGSITVDLTGALACSGCICVMVQMSQVRDFQSLHRGCVVLPFT
jgi:hypothetical protein